MYNENTKESTDMKKFAIILSILCFAPAAFAGGTVLYSSTVDPAVYYAQQQANMNAQQEATVSKTSEKERKFRLGTERNDPNSYWNFGRINFGSGFSSEGSSTKRF